MADNPFQGYVPQSAAAKMLQARQMQQQQAAASRILNDEMQSRLGASDSVDVSKAVPDAYFNAARRLSALGSDVLAQQLYQAGLQAKEQYTKGAVEIDKTRAETRQLDEPPTGFQNILNDRDQSAASMVKFPEGSPTRVALQRRVDDLNAQLTRLNAPQHAGSSAGLAEIVSLNEARKNEGKPPMSVAEEEAYLRRKQATSTDEQAYERYVDQGGKLTKEQWLPSYLAQRGVATGGGAEVAPRLTKLEDTATSSLQQLAAVKNAVDVLNEGAITGTGADARVWLARAMGTFLGGDVPQEVQQQAANSDVYLSAVAPIVLAKVRALAPVDKSDKDFIRQLTGGEISLTEPALRRILKITADTNASQIENYNTKLSNLGDEYRVLKGLYNPYPVPQIDFAAPRPKEALSDEDLIKRYSR